MNKFLSILVILTMAFAPILMASQMADSYTMADLEGDISDTSNILTATEVNTFAKLDTVVADKALLNEVDAPSVPITLFSSVVGSLPAAGTVGRIAVVTDATGATDCATGGNVVINTCIDDGTNWVDLI